MEKFHCVKYSNRWKINAFLNIHWMGFDHTFAASVVLLKVKGFSKFKYSCHGCGSLRLMSLLVVGWNDWLMLSATPSLHTEINTPFMLKWNAQLVGFVSRDIIWKVEVFTSLSKHQHRRKDVLRTFYLTKILSLCVHLFVGKGEIPTFI